MAQIKIDSSTINSIKSDDVASLLRKTIDAELSKDDEAVDTAFVDECVNALLELEQDENKGFTVLIPLVSANDYLNRITGRRYWNALSRKARVAVVAAVIATSTLVANAAVTGITGVNPLKEAGVFLYNTFEELTSNNNKDSSNNLPEKPSETEKNAQNQYNQTEEITEKPENKEEKPTPVEVSSDELKKSDEQKQNAQENKKETEKKKEEKAPENKTDDKQEEKTSTDEEEHIEPEHKPDPKPVKPTEEAVFSHIEADLKIFKHDYIYGETLTYKGLSVYAVFSDNSKKELSLSECTVTQSVDMHKTADYTLRVIYKDSVIKIPITVRPDEETRGSEIGQNENFDYLITENGAYLTAYHANESNLILDEVEGNSVYAVAASVFEETDVRIVVLPNAKKIFENAFKNCKQLTACFTPQASYIGDSAFEGCEKLQNADTVAASEYLGKSAYAQSGIVSIMLPSGISSVPEKLCFECSKLKTVNLGGAATVERSAFSDCTALEEVRGTANIKTVEETAFYGDETAVFETAPSDLETIETSGFAYCKKIKFGELKKLKSIGDFALMYCSGVTGVQLDENISAIPQGAFWGTRIKEIVLPEGLKRIESAAFMSTMLSKVTIPDAVEYIGARAFQTAGGLTVTFMGSPEIENAAFFKSSRLKFFAYEDSSAIEYAIENEIDYEIIERS